VATPTVCVPRTSKTCSDVGPLSRARSSTPLPPKRFDLEVFRRHSHRLACTPHRPPSMSFRRRNRYYRSSQSLSSQTPPLPSAGLQTTRCSVAPPLPHHTRRCRAPHCARPKARRSRGGALRRERGVRATRSRVSFVGPTIQAHRGRNRDATSLHDSQAEARSSRGDSTQ
jgi:hypothetical protein